MATTVCSQCGKVSKAAGRHYCDECGAALSGSRLEVSVIPSGNIVGDGSDRAMTGVRWGATRGSLVAAVRPGRLIRHAASAVVLVVGAVVLLTALAHLLVAVAPFMVFVGLLYAGGVFRGRRHTRRARYTYRHHRRWAP